MLLALILGAGYVLCAVIMVALLVFVGVVIWDLIRGNW